MDQDNRNRYIGSFTESSFEPLDLPFSVETLKQLLVQGTSANSPYTHQQIADWANRFWQECDEGSLADMADVDPIIAIAADIASDIDAQWDLFLYNTYSLVQLRHLDFSQVVLPHEWFEGWLQQLP